MNRRSLFFINFRRDGYDFESLWDDGKASGRQKKIMELFAEEGADAEYFSHEIRKKAGFGKDGESGFEGTITNLQMQLYLCVRDFRQKINKKGQKYGWAVGIYSTPEHIFGYRQVTSAYREDPAESGKKIAERIMEIVPTASESHAKKLIGIR